MSERVGLVVEEVEDYGELIRQRREDPRPYPLVLHRELVALRAYAYLLELEFQVLGDERMAEIVKGAWTRLHDATDRLEDTDDLDPFRSKVLPVLSQAAAEVEIGGAPGPAPDTEHRVGRYGGT